MFSWGIQKKERMRQEYLKRVWSRQTLWNVSFLIFLIAQTLFLSRFFPEMQDIRNETNEIRFDTQSLETLSLQRTADRYRRQEAETDYKRLDLKIKQLEERIATLEKSLKEGDLKCQQ